MTTITFVVQEFHNDWIDEHSSSTIEVARTWVKLWKREFPQTSFRIIERTTITTEKEVQ
jgi:hypothetical protein